MLKTKPWSMLTLRDQEKEENTNKGGAKPVGNKAEPREKAFWEELCKIVPALV